MTEEKTSSRSLNRIEISRSALRHNFALCSEKAGGATIMPMVKADGYGHGMVECARIFAEQGAAAFGVAEVYEGKLLREAGIEEPIYILLGPMPEAVPEIIEFYLTPVVVDSSLLADLAARAVAKGVEISLHIKMDAGMGRQGCLPEDVGDLVRRISELDGIHLNGIMAHFPMADEPDSRNTLEVFDRFQSAVVGVEDMLPENCCLHIANSGGLFHFSSTSLEMVRPGIALYGCSPDGKVPDPESKKSDLQPVMRFVTRVIQVRSVPAGTGLGYGQAYVTERRTSLAVLPVGYADGYLRALSGRADVLLHGQRAPVVGRISMNLTLVDVTDIHGNVARGDEAVLMGRQGDEQISADEVAVWLDTISYEVLCLLGNLNEKYYVD